MDKPERQKWMRCREGLYDRDGTVCGAVIYHNYFQPCRWLALRHD
jgi:hypothetical protein